MLVSPGAIRLVASVSGKPASACSVALSHVSHGTGPPPSRVGALRDEVLELRVDAARAPAEAQREVEHVHPEVAHHADLAAVDGLALPVDRLGAVEVARVQERVLGLDRLPERPGADVLVGQQRAGEVRHLARAAREDVRPLVERGGDPAGGRQVDPERLLAHEVLARGDRLEVQLLVEVVRDREVEDVEVRVLEQPAAVVGDRRDRRDALEPAAGGLARVADRGEPRRHRVVLERGPAADRGGELTAHQAAADDPDPDRLAAAGHPSSRPLTAPTASSRSVTTTASRAPRRAWRRRGRPPSALASSRTGSRAG